MNRLEITTRRSILCAILLVPHVASAQYDFSENANGTLRVRRSSSTDGELFFQFGFSRGAYRNGIKLLNLSTSRTCSAGAGAIESDCMFYTKDCEVCGQDPNAGPGEISCFCKKKDPQWSISEPIVFVPGGQSVDVDLGLVTDTSRSDTINQRLFAQPTMNPMGGDQMRTYKLTPTSGRIDWEDIPQAPNGDYNDVMVFIQGRDCDRSDGFPPDTTPEQVEYFCTDFCTGDGDCQDPEYISQSELRVTVTLTIDSLLSETGGVPEAKGRLVHLTVATYGSGAVAGRKIAVCPNLILKNKGGVSVDFHDVGYGRDLTNAADPCGTVASPDGMPLCDTTGAFPNQFLFWAVSRDQHFVKRSCDASRTGVGDTFELMQPDMAVGGNCSVTMPHVEMYELALADLDTVLNQPPLNIQTETMNDSDLLDLFDGVQLAVVIDVAAHPFHCPVGLNNLVRTVDTSVGTLQSVDLQQNPLLFNYFEDTRN